MSKSTDNFGVNEMTALLGGAHSLTEQEKQQPLLYQKASKQKKDPNDVADLTTAQTAALLKNHQPSVKTKMERHFAKKSKPSSRQAVVEELLQLQQREEQPQESSSSSEEEEEEFTIRKQQRVKKEPQIVLERPAKPRPVRHDSSSSSEASSSSSESDDDASVDKRRQRLLAKKRQRQVPEIVVQKKPQEPEAALPEVVQPIKPKSLVEPPSKSSSSSSEGETESSSSESSSSEEESSSSEEELEVEKPLFVPKHLRNKKSQEKVEEEEEQKWQAAQNLDQARKMESRAMVAKLTEQESKMQGMQQEEQIEGGGAANAMPNHDDPDDPIQAEAERDAWEVRELQRLLEELDQQVQMQQEQQEQQERGNLDVEQDDDYQQQNHWQQSRNEKEANKQKVLQRYHHRGAFYMDTDEFEEGDIRNRAAEYSRAVTASDVRNYDKLPQVMQKKKFGFANQSKYKGLVKEDTTDKSQSILPIVKKQKRR